MALYSTDKPIAYTMQNAGWRNVFKPYSISCDLWKTANGTLNENILFSGRTWFDKNGYTTILLSTILRDYTFKHPAKFDNDKQTVVPSTFNALQSNIFPLENENDKSFFTGRFYINVDGTRVATYYVTSLSQQVLTPIPNGETFCPYYVGNQFALLDNNVYNSNGNYIHLPMVNSDKLFFETNVALSNTYQQDATQYVLTSDGTNNALLNFRFYGNYSFCLPMSYIYSVIGANVNIEHQPFYLKMENATDGEHSLLLFYGDICPKQYYLIWNGNCGFYSWGCEGATLPSVTKDDLKLTNLYDIEKVIKNKTKYGWNINTGLLNKDEMNAVLSVLQAANVWLYETETDTLHNVTVTDTTKNGWRSNNAKFENITFKVEETITHIF